MNEFRTGWPPLLAATVGTMCGLLTITNYSQGFFVGPVTQEFGWTPPQFFLGFTVMMCVGLLTGPWVGSLVPRYGLRTLGMLGLLGHAVGYVLLSFNTGSLTTWYLTWALFAVLSAGSLPIIWTTVLNGWFRENRGKAIGITMAGTGLGAFILPPVVEFFITNHDWRTAYRAVGVGAFAISLPVVYFLFRENDRPAVASLDESGGDWGLTRAEALRTAKFWVLLALLFTTVLVVAGLLSNFKPLYDSKGMEGGTIAGIAAIMGATVVVGRLLVGALVDRFWAPAVGCVFFTLPIVGMLLLLNLELTPTTGLIAAVFIGLAAGAELDMLAYLTSRYFGPAHYPAIFGAVYASFSVGAGIAAPLTGKIAADGGYDSVLVLFIVLLVVSLGLFLALGKYPQARRAEQP